MRTKSEVLELYDKLEMINRGIGAAAEYDDESMMVFNGNARLLCALKWVLGEDTIKVYDGGADPETAPSTADDTPPEAKAKGPTDSPGRD